MRQGAYHPPGQVRVPRPQRWRALAPPLCTPTPTALLTRACLRGLPCVPAAGACSATSRWRSAQRTCCAPWATLNKVRAPSAAGARGPAGQCVCASPGAGAHGSALRPGRIPVEIKEVGPWGQGRLSSPLGATRRGGRTALSIQNPLGMPAPRKRKCCLSHTTLPGSLPPDAACACMRVASGASKNGESGKRLRLRRPATKSRRM